VKEYTPPAPEAAGVEVPANRSIESLKAEGESKRAALEAWCRTAYGEVRKRGVWGGVCGGRGTRGSQEVFLGG
jgi:hypothetical protein